MYEIRPPRHANSDTTAEKKKQEFSIEIAEILSFLRAGLSVVPVDPETKKSTIAWKRYQTTPLTEAEARRLRWPGVAVIGGEVSGGVEILDFDFRAAWGAPWADTVDAQAPGLLDRLVKQKTQSDGRHIIYRCTVQAGNAELAHDRLVVPGPGDHIPPGGKKTIRAIQDGADWIIQPCMIETRRTGGYALIYPTPGYELMLGDLRAIPEITPDERCILIDVARGLSKKPLRGTPARHASRKDGDRPGDQYSRDTDFRALLESHGWTPCRTSGHSEFWARPGKDDGGHSASLTGGWLHVFSSNAAPLESDRSYDAFGFFAAVEHGGDHRAAATALAKARPATPPPPPSPTSADDYYIRDGITWWRRPTSKGTIPTPLANFSAVITAERVHDDGAERRILFDLAATLRGTAHHITLPAPRFSAMSWPTEDLGCGAIIEPGPASRDRLRVAIQVLSGTVERTTVYAHTGWRQVDGQWTYLHAGGGISASGPVQGVSTDLGHLGSYSLPAPPPQPDAVTALRQVHRYWSGLSPAIGHMMQASIIRPLLAEVDTPPYSIFLVGPTGVWKSTLAAIALAAYGPEMTDARHIPANFSSTANALERLAFLSKDAMLVVDDLAPASTPAEQARQAQITDRIFRSAGNSDARARLTADGSLRPMYRPRGLVVATGEDIPQGHSIRSRCVVIEMTPGLVTADQITLGQSLGASGVMARAQAAIVQWLAPRIDHLRDTYAAQRLAVLGDLGLGGHARHGMAAADMVTTLGVYLQCMQDLGAMTEDEAEAHMASARASIVTVITAQGAHMRDVDPADRIIALLSTILATGRGHLASMTGQCPELPGAWGWTDGGSPVPLGDRLGWVAESGVYLSPDAAYAACQRLAREQGAVIPTSRTRTWKAMAARGLLAAQADDRLVQRIYIGGTRVSALHLPHGAIEGGAS